jgi:hypothetical protein
VELTRVADHDGAGGLQLLKRGRHYVDECWEDGWKRWVREEMKEGGKWRD